MISQFIITVFIFAAIIMVLAFHLLWEVFKLVAVILLALFILSMLSSCDSPDEWAEHTTTPKVVDKRPRMCDNLYNVGKHREWAECMGVGYVHNND